ncbi:tripartite tricarboxylate transporter substrate binding protein [Vibrio gazogenes]|uniref:Tripartite-type tricarboxylate transporter, receptor component TctC n=1 Tax=Vibrio gazogenes DSM 21264 = NBRC 103151 TaxID=1123492 RepID=A0A1M4U3D3_VIBGA|nr:tripartite tricarboxylate transporter substrate-binding protein [Vibrio gazogenes]USP16225.1 tricarboxylate transporter [Vibrio gazogenes]SHE51037.1 Tripartite-type tricarboxylate transporter, receptor component TctC [Vibrio gazogenes DSM 21264] [Vibrio gazogenes DSM 21264 = NBRC 103151]SJN53150.1 Tripartite tricarboxylate transporter family receptor [Vibrio gazogenes]
MLLSNHFNKNVFRVSSQIVSTVFMTFCLTSAGNAQASSHEQSVSFEDERIEVTVPYKEGGGTDTWARFFGPYFSQSLPGNPVVVIRNIPGGGSTKGANQFARRASDNGLDVLASSASTHYTYLLNDRRVRYDYNDWTPVLATPTGGVVYISADEGIKNAEQLVNNLDKLQFKYASQGATTIDLVPLLALDLIGADVQAVFGMKGRGAGRLAFERGEVNIDSQTSSAYLKKVVPLVKEGKAIPLFSFGVVDDQGHLQRDPNFPDLPHFGEVYQLAKGDIDSSQGFKVWRSFFIAGFVAQKVFFLPKSTPQEVQDAWRDAMIKLVAEPDFQKRAKEILGNYQQLTGTEVDQAVNAILSLDENSKKWVAKWLKEKYNTRL